MSSPTNSSHSHPAPKGSESDKGRVKNKRRNLHPRPKTVGEKPTRPDRKPSNYQQQPPVNSSPKPSIPVQQLPSSSGIPPFNSALLPSQDPTPPLPCWPMPCGLGLRPFQYSASDFQRFQESKNLSMIPLDFRNEPSPRPLPSFPEFFFMEGDEILDGKPSLIPQRALMEGDSHSQPPFSYPPHIPQNPNPPMPNVNPVLSTSPAPHEKAPFDIIFHPRVHHGNPSTLQDRSGAHFPAPTPASVELGPTRNIFPFPRNHLPSEHKPFAYTSTLPHHTASSGAPFDLHTDFFPDPPHPKTDIISSSHPSKTISSLNHFEESPKPPVESLFAKLRIHQSTAVPPAGDHPALPPEGNHKGPVRNKPKESQKMPSVAHLDQISTEMLELCESICPSPTDREKRIYFVSRVQSILQTVFPECQLLIYGSSGNGFCLKSVDVDASLFNVGLDSKASTETASNIVNQIAAVLEKHNMRDVLPLPKTRVPIVKFRDPVSNISCDICIENRLAILNTRLLRTYSLLDWRLVPFSLIIKYWSKRRRINDPYLGTLSSYSFIMMVIFFFQTRKVPILPCLQRILPSGGEIGPHEVDSCPEKPRVLVNNFDCYFFDNLEGLQKMGYSLLKTHPQVDSTPCYVNGRKMHTRARNTESLGELFFAFFHYFAHQFDYYDSVISIRSGILLDKESKSWTSKQASPQDKYWMCIEDPFEVTHNLCRVVNKSSLFDIRGEFMRSCRLLCDNASLSDICSEFKKKDE